MMLLSSLFHHLKVLSPKCKCSSYFGGDCYYIWKERNSRLFKKKFKAYTHIFDDIVSLVRLKVLSFRFKKNSIAARHIIDKCKVPSSFVGYVDSTSRL